MLTRKREQILEEPILRLPSKQWESQLSDSDALGDVLGMLQYLNCSIRVCLVTNIIFILTIEG